MENMFEFSELFPWLGLLIGSCLGSFLNVVAYRLPRDESVVSPRSKCPSCQKPIPWSINLPLLGWLYLKGRAQCCGAKISPRYPIVEGTVGLLFAWIFYSFMLDQDVGIFVSSCLFVWIMIGVVVIDFETMLIPDRFSIGGACLGLCLSIYFPSLHMVEFSSIGASRFYSTMTSLTGILIGSGLLYWIGAVAGRIMGREALGEGDVKLLGCIGAFCGWQGAVFSIFGGALLGCLLFLPILVLQKIKLSPFKGHQPLGFGVELPFGPYLAMAGLGYFFGLSHWIDPWFGWTKNCVF